MLIAFSDHLTLLVIAELAFSIFELVEITLKEKNTTLGLFFPLRLALVFLLLYLQPTSRPTTISTMLRSTRRMGRSA